MEFKKWIMEIAGATAAVYDPKVKLKTANWEGTTGSTGKVIEGEPIKHWVKKKSGRAN